MSVIIDLNDYDNYSVGIVTMEGRPNGALQLTTAYDALQRDEAKHKNSSLSGFKEIWTSDRKNREDAYAENELAGHKGALDLGHTAIFVRQEGLVSICAGFVPTRTRMNDWPCPGKWVNNEPMLKDPKAISMEVAVTSDEAQTLSEKLEALMVEAEGRRYHFKVEKTSVQEKSQGSYNCIAAAISVLQETLTEYKVHWDGLLENCQKVGFSQSRVKAGIMTGWMDPALP